jgi:hypothetical protein
MILFAQKGKATWKNLSVTGEERLRAMDLEHMLPAAGYVAIDDQFDPSFPSFSTSEERTRKC